MTKRDSEDRIKDDENLALHNMNKLHFKLCEKKKKIF